MTFRTLFLLSITYLLLPFLIFCVGFLRWYVAVVLILSLLYSGVFAVKQIYRKEYSWRLSSARIFVLIGVSAFLCWFCGVGGYFSQSYDWIVKNPLLNDLTLSSWPLVIDFSEADTDIQSLCGEGQVAFVYYLFYYLPAAWVGSLFCSTTVSRIVLFLWSAYGLLLVLCWLLYWLSTEGKLSRRKTSLALVLFICWGGMDIVGMVFKAFSPWDNIQWSWSSLPLLDSWCQPFFMYHSSLASLYWCFNQCIPLWLITMMILNSLDSRFLLFLYSFSILYSPWGAIGLLPIVLAIEVSEVRKWGWSNIKNIINFANVGFPLLLLFVVGSYYASNKTPIAEKGFIWQFWEIEEWPFVYVAFILVEIGVYVYLMRKESNSDLLLSVTIATLVVIPLYKMNYANDFALRASIPALFVLFAIWTRWSMEHYHQKRWAILTVFLICSLGACHLIGFNAFRTIHQGRPDTYYENERFTSVDNTKLAILGEAQFYAHDYENTFFWKYMAK